jgi:hypothetical protein
MVDQFSIRKHSAQNPAESIHYPVPGVSAEGTNVLSLLAQQLTEFKSRLAAQVALRSRLNAPTKLTLFRSIWTRIDLP